MPTITDCCRGRPTIDGNTARGASSPAKPAFTMPEPLSHTSACESSPPSPSESDMLLCESRQVQYVLVKKGLRKLLNVV